MSLDIEERELPIIQRGLVDTCFEEAQYESGIDVLYGLRSSRYKPPPLHIRQLIYIALYPPPPPKQALDINELPDAPPSPQKIILQKDDLWPKPIARQKALTLLRSYVGINLPQSLMRAFPFYPYVNEVGTNDANPFDNESLEEKFHDDNTPLQEEILKFQSLKDCWGCLKERFSKRSLQDPASSSKRQITLDNGTSEQQTALIGPYAWPVLEWLISVFEKDQELQQLNGGMTFSPLLLVQIPSPKVRRGPRAGIDVPMEILKECFTPPQDPIVSNSSVDFIYTTVERRQELGMRLLSLLFNLTRTNPPLLSSSQLKNSLAIMLRSFELDALDSFLSSLSLDQAVFKANILEHLMTKHEERTAAPKAKARAKPKAKGVEQTHIDSTPKDGGLVEGAYVVPSLERFTSLVSSRASPDGQDALSMALKKYHLVSAIFQARDGVSLTTYDEAVRTRSLRKSIEEGFKETQGVACKYKKIALSIIQAWEKQI